MYKSGSKQFAPGVSVIESDTLMHFWGHAAPLVAAGVIQNDWLPGNPGVRATRALVILDAQGNGIVAPRGSRARSCEGEFGYVMIYKSGSLFHVNKFKPRKERERCEAERIAACTSETWQTSKELANTERDFPSEWRRNVVAEARKTEKLVNGHLCYSGFPDIALDDADRRLILDAVEDLVKAINAATPFVKRSKYMNGNVIRLDDYAHSGMRKAI